MSVGPTGSFERPDVGPVGMNLPFQENCIAIRFLPSLG
jgi:hypothetical protein